METEELDPTAEAAPAQKITRRGCLVTAIGFVLLLVYDTSPLWTVSARRERLKQLATPGRQWTDVKPMVEKEGYRGAMTTPSYTSFAVPVLLNRQDPLIARVVLKLALRFLDNETIIKYGRPYLDATNATIVVEDGEVAGVL